MSKGHDDGREKAPAKMPAARRQTRQAQALRANLARRKAQSRARRGEINTRDPDDPSEA